MSETTHQEFSQQNPLSFALYNFHVREDRNLLYINDNPDELRFNLEIKNSFSETIKLSHTQSKPEAPSPNNYHIELKFRPNQLSPRSREKIDLSEDSKEGWSMSRPYENRDRTVSLFLLKRKDELVIEKEGTKLITLAGLGANSTDGARVTQLEINYKDFYFAQEKFDENANTERRVIDSQTQIIILTVLNYSGKRASSLTVTFAYAATLLNNGSNSEPLVLQIVNTGSDAITLNENSRFEITIDAQGDREEPWALAKKDEAIISKISIGKELILEKELSQKYWLIEEPKPDLEDPTWIIRPNFAWNQKDGEQDRVKQFTFKQNEDFFITISNFKSSLRPGIGNLYVAYYNLPGYMDGKRILNVTKTCITERKGGKDADGRIGINKYPDSKTQLDVKGKIASDFLEVKGDAVANSLTVNNTVSARKFEGEGAFVTGMIIMWSGAADGIPYGWALCDGTKGTPDLKGRFILSAGDEYALNQSGGSKQHNYKVKVLGHQLTQAEIPAHSHRYRVANRFDGRPDGGEDHGEGGYYWMDARNYKSGWGDSSEQHWDTSSVGNSNSHNHEATMQPQESDQMPPYYVLCFIMKIRMRDILATGSEDLILKRDDNKDIDWYAATGYTLIFQKDGNLVLYNIKSSSKEVVWATGTNGKAEKFTALKDGNFALFNSKNEPIWSTKTSGKNRLVLEESGNLVVYSQNGEIVFQTETTDGAKKTIETAKNWQK
ncbi:MAG: hypothetical protein RMY62_016285 [Nostoc sp. ZfuVER08]|jgi:hypothetical protein|nr:hypothetical protein [Nostoc sp. GBBB01]MDZ8012711.1 hypothetical protein [Nostoc sp. ZfuVER08]